jgi:HAD superfamily hydrolase (TIGR01490 family)
VTTRPAIAFFDLDRTLIHVNSAKGWVQREVRTGHLRRRDAARVALWLAAYHAGWSDLDRMIRTAVTSLAGTGEADLDARVEAFWQEELAHTVRPGAHAAIARHRACGDRLVILTASSPYVAERARVALDLHDILCNRFEVVDGRFTGQPVLPLCYGAGKATLARDYADQQGISLDSCAFYTDSYSDLAALEAVGRPVVVHPDPRLARAARERGWAIEDWGPAA